MASPMATTWSLPSTTSRRQVASVASLSYEFSNGEQVSLDSRQ